MESNTVIEELRILLETEEKTWKRIRKLVHTIESEKLYAPCVNITQWMEENFPKNFKNLLCELAAARIEVLLEIPISTLPYFQWRSLFRLNPWKPGKWVSYKKQKGARCIKELRFDQNLANKAIAVWTFTCDKAKKNNREFPTSDDLHEALRELHKTEPDKFDAPTPRCGSEQWRWKTEELEREIQSLREENLQLKQEKELLIQQSLGKNNSKGEKQLQQEVRVLQKQLDEILERIERFHQRWKNGTVSPHKALSLLFISVTELTKNEGTNKEKTKTTELV